MGNSVKNLTSLLVSSIIVKQYGNNTIITLSCLPTCVVYIFPLISIFAFAFAFTGTDGPLGKRLNNTRTSQVVGWEPKYLSFARFLQTPEFVFLLFTLIK